MVNSDPDSLRKFSVQTCGLQLKETEASRQTFDVVVPLGLASSNGSQQMYGSRRDGFNILILKTCSSLLTVKLSSSLSCWLVEPSSNETGPMFSQMDVREHIVVLYHLK
jgi:hypothetical protein